MDSNGGALYDWLPQFFNIGALQGARFINNSKVVLAENNGSSYRIHEYAITGGVALNVIDNSNNTQFPCPSADGTKHIYRRTATQDQMYTANAGADLSGRTQLTTSATDKEFPCFSPDGLSFAYFHYGSSYTVGSIRKASISAPDTATIVSDGGFQHEINNGWKMVKT
jgi:Tol biopolymer transport system component